MGKRHHPQATVYSGMPGSTGNSISNASSTHALKLRSGRIIQKTKANESHASASLASDEDTTSTFPFLKLSAELRIQIYRYLLHAHGDICIYRLDRTSPTRSQFLGKISGEMMTYRVDAIGVHPAILSVNRQMYLEASRIFYSENRLNFCSDKHQTPSRSIETVILFLEDRSEGSWLLIKQIQYVCIATNAYLDNGLRFFANFIHVFEETCTYLSQKLQLEHVTLNYVHFLIYAGSNIYADHVPNMDEQSWVQQLVPLVTNLHTLRFNGWGGQDDELMRAAQTYLESKMDKASKKISQTQSVQQLAHDGGASEE